VRCSSRFCPRILFLSDRFSQFPLVWRLLWAFLYVALPDSFEIDANITTIQWHLALTACLVLFALPAKSWAWRAFDIATLVLISVDGPMGILLVPGAATLWWIRRTDWARALCLSLFAGAIVQTLTVMTSLPERLGAPNGANLTRFVHILARQVFLSGLLGIRSAAIFLKLPFAGEVLVTIVGLSALIYAVWRGPAELKLFILFVTTAFAAALAHPLATRIGFQWEDLGHPGWGNRYFFFPVLAFLAALFWISSHSRAPSRGLRKLAVIALLLLPVGVLSDWRYPRFADLHFQTYARAFEKSPPGTHMTIPINPVGWYVELSKH
jgi:phosphatidylserine synthase